MSDALGKAIVFARMPHGDGVLGLDASLYEIAGEATLDIDQLLTSGFPL